MKLMLKTESDDRLKSLFGHDDIKTVKMHARLKYVYLDSTYGYRAVSGWSTFKYLYLPIMHRH